MDMEKEIFDTVSKLPDNPPLNALDYLKEKGYLPKEMLIYRSEYAYIPLEDRKKRMVKVTCTSCKESTYLERMDPVGYSFDKFGFFDETDKSVKTTGNSCICPCCGEPLEALHISHFKKDGQYLMDSTCFLTIHSIRKHLCLLLWEFEKLCDKEGNVFYIPHKKEGVILIGKKLIRVTGQGRNLGGYVRYFNKWELRKRFDDYIEKISKELIIPFNKEVIYETNAEKSGLEDFIKYSKVTISPVAYLKLWAKYPNVENLARGGFSDLIEEIIGECSVSSGYYYNITQKFNIRKVKNYLNLKKAKPHEILGLQKDDLHIAKKGLHKLELYKYLKSKKIKIAEKALDDIPLKFDAGDILEFIKEPFHGYIIPPIHFLNYMSSGNKSLWRLKDYWNMIFEFYGEMVSSLLYPKDLIKAHNDILHKIQEKEDKELSENIFKQSKKYLKFTFEDKETGLLIRPVKSQKELIEEGKVLDHCVATYSKDVASGKTEIFFIRKISEPDKPYFTLEFKNGKVSQNRGFKNCARTEEVESFENKWICYIKKLKGVKKNGNSNATA